MLQVLKYPRVHPKGPNDPNGAAVQSVARHCECPGPGIGDDVLDLAGQIGSAISSPGVNDSTARTTTQSQVRTRRLVRRRPGRMYGGLASLTDLASPVPDGLPRLSIFDFRPLADILACHCAPAHTPVTGQMEQGGRRFGAGMRNPAFTARRTHARSGYPCHPNLLLPLATLPMPLRCRRHKQPIKLHSPADERKIAWH